MPLNPLIKLKSALCVLGFFIASIAFSQVQIWGTSETGGEDAIGSIYSVLTNGNEYTLESPFINSQEGASPKSSLVVATDGTIYGISAQGGENNSGTIFRYNNGDFEVLHQLESSTDGNNANAELIQKDDNTFIGATFNGGENGGGVLFEYSLISGFNALFHFSADGSGANPSGSLVYENGNIYGSCSNGGLSGFGSIWKYTDSNLTVLHHFEGEDLGSYPRSGVTLASDGSLYGSAQFGGENNQGAIFKLNTDGAGFEIIYNLNNTTADGRYPLGRLVESSPGTFLGLCSDGGNSGSGTVFKVTTEGEYTVLKGLQSSVDGGFPKAGMSKEINGKFYGVTEFGGANGFGTIFSVEESGNFNKLHDFNYSSDGANPQSSLTINGSVLVGVTATGGANNFGTIIEFDSEQEVQKLHDFSLPLGGAAPEGLIARENTFYGITSTGGVYNTGTYYNIELNGQRTKLHDFDPEMEGQNPNGDLFWYEEDNLFYGSAKFGGLLESGSIFTLTESGELTVLHFFEGGAQGEFPYASPVLHSNGKIYGTTISGGDFGDGVLYSIDSEGNYEVLFSFFGFFDGASCESQLVETEDGMLYGLCSEGGSLNSGSLFQFNPETNTLSILHNFNSASDGSFPKGKLLLHSDGKLYGTTQQGINGGGSIFRYSEEDGFELLHAFQPSIEGSFASGGLTEGDSENLYGVCRQGGSNSFGTCFKYHEMDGLQLVYTFSGAESPNPSGQIALFFPECNGDEDCVSDDVCSLSFCNFGLCTEIPINPSFTVLNTSTCEESTNQFELELQLDLDVSPGGTLSITDQEIELSEEETTYQFTLLLDSDGEEINLDYFFAETGCEGTTGSLGTAPLPCNTTEVTFVLDVNELEVNPEGMHLAGDFQNWSPGDLPMINMGDGIWELTVDIALGNYAYKFYNGNDLSDAENIIGECTENGDRQLSVGEEAFTVEACWESCNANCSLGLAERSIQKNIDLYPNTGARGFEMQLIIGESIFSGNYEVLDATGRKIFSGPANHGRNTISTSSLNSGLFHLIIYEKGSAIAAKRFIVK